MAFLSLHQDEDECYNSVVMRLSKWDPEFQGFDRIVVILIKPSSYDDEGFPQRFLRGVLPSNSLAALYSLTKDSLEKVLPDLIPIEIHVCEDGIEGHARRLERLERRFPEEGAKLIVGLVA